MRSRGAFASRARRAIAIPGLLVIILAAIALWSQVGGVPPAPVAVACERAGLVDGELRCGDELPREPGALCPGTGPESASPIMSGDALRTAQLCARPWVEPHTPEHGWERMSAEDLATLGLPVELDAADETELSSLPRIGPVLARRIIQGRPYTAFEDLLSVRGIGPATLQRLRPRVVISRGRS
ncbi:MAG: helix-hairpin-helix domain-containing protein [Myxococcota bacterium]